MPATTQLHDVGQHFLLGLQRAPTLQRHDRDILRRLNPAGIVVFRDNFDHGAEYAAWHASFATLLGDVADCLSRDRFIVGIDHEGGRVVRPPPPVTHFDYAARWAGNAAKVGRAMGCELASLGINVDFAPCLDIHSNPANPVIGPRAFATTADGVADAALCFAGGLQEQGVMACGKHFPGHGDTAEDSHYTVPISNASRDTLQNREFVPFARAVAAGLPMLMSSHVVVPALDPDKPATLSAPVVRDQLRGTMRFGGVIVTDDLCMQAMDGYLSAPDAAVDIATAGHDLLMLCAHWGDTGRILDLAADLHKAGQRSGFLTEVLAPSRQRIATCLAHLQQPKPQLLPPETFDRHRQLAPIYTGERAAIV